jgi:hypothetical protein
VLLEPFSRGEDAGGFDHQPDVKLLPGQRFRIFLVVYRILLAVDDQMLVVVVHVSLVPPVHSVVLQQVSEIVVGH